MTSDSPFTGRYLFHLHTDLTDGRLSVRDYFDHARRLGVERLIFLEHVRRTPSYDVSRFVAVVREHAEAYGLPAFIGFEAKLLPDGGLDIGDEDLDRAEVIGIAEHGFPDDPAVLEAAFLGAVDAYRRLADKAIVWVHPGLWFRKRQRVPDAEPTFRRMLDYARDAALFIEKNLRYDLVSDTILAEIPVERVVVGADVHSAADLECWRHAVP